MNYKTYIGLEVHVELNTKTKMFCACSADYFGKKPNTHTCPVCLGLPGALPVPNKEAIRWCKKIGLSLNCSLPYFSKFDRKNYFYPDLAKGYQISQYDKPFCIKGCIELSNKRIGITRVHMEEDTGKLVHSIVNGKKVSLIDFNRSGVPLVEIVTEPDFENADEVVEYLKKLQQIVRYLGVSNADMEKGDMRLEPNISVSPAGLPNYKVEIKNINSFRFVKKGIEFEIQRQRELLEKGEKINQETRGWDEKKQRTVTQRSKEEAKDYRYFPEPDIPPIRWTEEENKSLKLELGELPDEKVKRFIEQYKLSDYNAEIITRDKSISEFFELFVEKGKLDSSTVANFLINKKVDPSKASYQDVVKEITNSLQKDKVSEEELDSAIEKAIEENSKALDDYRNGKESALMFLLGQSMRKLGKKVDTALVKKRLLDKINI